MTRIERLATERLCDPSLVLQETAVVADHSPLDVDGGSHGAAGGFRLLRTVLPGRRLRLQVVHFHLHCVGVHCLSAGSLGDPWKGFQKDVGVLVREREE